MNSIENTQQPGTQFPNRGKSLAQVVNTNQAAQELFSKIDPEYAGIPKTVPMIPQVEEPVVVQPEVQEVRPDEAGLVEFEDPFTRKEVTQAPQQVEESEPQEESIQEFLDKKAKKPTKEESFAALRRKVSEEKESKQQIEQELQQARQLLESYKTGEALPEKVKEMQDTINELREFQRLHDLKTTPEYQEKFINPLKEAKEQITNLAKDYGIPAEVIQEAVKHTNARDLNSFLSEHFDVVGAVQARDIIKNIQSLEQAKTQAESQPGDVYERLVQEAQERRIQEKQQTFNKNKDTSLLAWKDAHSTLSDETQFPEFTVRGDNSPQDTYAKPIVDRARQEFSKLVHYLSDKGVPLDDKFLQIMAKRMLLSEAAAVMAKSRADIYNHAQQVIEGNKRSAKYDRPTVGTTVGTASNGGGYNQSSRMTPQTAADAILGQVLNKNS